MGDQTSNKSDEELKKEPPPGVYHVTREKGTEPPFSGKYYKPGSKGMFQCYVCGNQLFSSDAQYDSRMPGLAGWPSFEEALPGAVKFAHDPSMGMDRTEVLCTKCGSHLGHVFDGDTDAKTGKHYCINSCALKLEE